LLRWYDCNIYLSSMHNSKHNTQTTLACLHTRTLARMRTYSTSACLHTLVRLCYGPKQAVAHVFMPVMSVGNPSKSIAAKMGVRGCREDSVLEAPGPYW